MKRSKRGVTLIEVLLAGAITALVIVCVMQGVIVSVGICRENSELLAAEAYAWDTAWKWLNKKDEELNASATPQYYPSADGFNIASNECPVIYRSAAMGSPKCYVCVSGVTLASGDQSNLVKRIDVNVEWGATGSRYCLNRIGSAAAKTYNVPVTVYKCPIDRGEELGE